MRAGTLSCCMGTLRDRTTKAEPSQTSGFSYLRCCLGRFVLVQRLGQLGSPSCWEATLSKANIILLESKAHKDLRTFCWACLLQILPPSIMSPLGPNPST